MSVGRTLIALLSVLIPISLLTQYVRVDLKLPDQTWIWALNNLFFVCFAEEAFFRGISPERLDESFAKNAIHVDPIGNFGCGDIWTCSL